MPPQPLVVLNEMTGMKRSTDELMRMGAKLGADVPFLFLEKPPWLPA